MYSVAVFGGTGATGKCLLQELINSERVDEVHMIVRRKVNLKDDKLKIHVCDFSTNFDDLDLNVKAVFCCIGTTKKIAGSAEAFYKVDHDLVLDIARWAKSKKIAEFHLQSTFGANAQAGSFYLKTKGEVEAELEKLDFNKLRIYRPSILAGARRDDFRLGEELGFFLLKAFSGLFSSMSYLNPVEVNSVARFMSFSMGRLDGQVVIIDSSEINEFGMPLKRYFKVEKLSNKVQVIMSALGFLFAGLCMMSSLPFINGFGAMTFVYSLILLLIGLNIYHGLGDQAKMLEELKNQNIDEYKKVEELRMMKVLRRLRVILGFELLAVILGFMLIFTSDSVFFKGLGFSCLFWGGLIIFISGFIKKNAEDYKFWIKSLGLLT